MNNDDELKFLETLVKVLVVVLVVFLVTDNTPGLLFVAAMAIAIELHITDKYL